MRRIGIGLIAALFCSSAAFAQAADLRIPASCAYAEPDGEAVAFEEDKAAENWTDGKQSIVWYGDLRKAGTLRAAVALKLPPGERVTLRLALSGRPPSERAFPKERKIVLPTVELSVTGGQGDVTADFGEFKVPEAGYWRFALSGMKKSGATFGSPISLTLSGTATEEANINRSKWRSPASVHLGYPLPKNMKAVAAYAEVKATADPIHTYYCALGFRRGYFGMQVNGPKERRIIFSVWDAGNEAVDRNKVASDNRVQLIAKGKDVFTDSFGNEGTGGHSHLVYSWKTNQTQRFLVTAEPKGDTTIYSGYFYFPERRGWGLIASFRAPKDGGYLGGLYSFNEVFGGDYGQKQRRAEFGRQFAQGADGKWLELTEAKFTHTARNEPLVRHDWGGGVYGTAFFLENGGFITEPATYGDAFFRAPSPEGPPTDIKLPPN